MSDQDEEPVVLVEVAVSLLNEARKLNLFNSPWEGGYYTNSDVVDEILIQYIGEYGSLEWNRKNVHRFV